MLGLSVIALAVLVMSAAFFAMAETALTHMSRAKALALAEEDRRGANALARLLERPERVLNPILLLVLACHVLTATLLAVVVRDRWGTGALAVAVVVEVIVLFLLGEAIPKTYALLKTERAALVVAPGVAVLSRILPLRLLTRFLIWAANVILPGPGRRAGPSVSEEELLALADVSEEAGVIETEERDLIESIIEFGDTLAREVMVPRPDMVTVPAGATVDDAIGVVLESGFSRVPAVGRDADDIVGVVFAKDLMRADRDGLGAAPIEPLLREVQFVPETKQAAELLREMQRRKFHLAVVVDEYGGTAGLVTLEDLIEELVGEIVDEFDVDVPSVQPLPGGDVIVDARLSIDEFNELDLPVDLPEGDWDTVGGFLVSALEHLPAEGESVPVERHLLAAEKVAGRRVITVRVSEAPPPALDAEEGSEEAAPARP